MSKKIFAGIFVSFLGLFFVWNLIGEDVQFSEQENRPLTQKPIFTWDNFVSGKFTAQFEKYISDQFPWKNGWVGLKAKVEKTIGKKENNGVLFGDDGYLLERFTQVGEQLEKNIDHVNTFAKQAGSLKTYLLLAPTATGIYPEKLPRFATSLAQNDLLNQIEQEMGEEIRFMNAYDLLVRHKEEALYFKTDHHWTMRGAYHAYVAAAPKMGYMPLPIDAFTVATVSKAFQGTLYSKASAYDAEPDGIELFIPKEPVQVRVESEDGATSKSLFAMDFLAQKDKYAVFLGGNHSLVKIEATAGTGKRLAVIKDSYAHAFIPFLTNHYDEIHVIDLRYFKLNVQDYMEENGVDEVLFLYNLPNFAEDRNLLWIK